MKTLKPNEVNQPIGALIVEEPKVEDWEMKLGAEERPDINTSGNWKDTIIEYELQRNSYFDNWSCVTFSLFNKVQCIINHCYKEKIDWSKRASAVQNGTKPRQGNTVSAPCEHLRKKGAWLEEDYTTMTPHMTESEYFKPVPQEVIEKEVFSKDWVYNHEYLPRYNYKQAKLDVLKKALKKSPIMVTVEGRYSFDNKGRIIWGNRKLSHEVLLVAIEKDIAYILDSENDRGLLPFDINYKFHYPKIGYVSKLTPTPMKLSYKDFIFRNADTGKIYFLRSDSIIRHIETEEVFKELFGEPAWNNQDWTNSDTESMSHLLIREGEPITKSNKSLIDAILQSIQNFGKKICKKI